MRVLQVVADGNPGGGTTAVLALCKQLKNRHQARITILTSPDSYALSTAKALGFDAISTDFFSSFRPSLNKAAREAIDAFSPDVIHFHGFRAAWVLARALKTQLNKPQILTIHGYHFLHANPIKRILGAVSFNYIRPAVDVVTHVSLADVALARAAKLSQSCAESLVISNGVDVKALRSIKRSPDTYDMTFVARLVPEKDPEFFISLIKALNIPIKAAIAGGGPLYNRVAEQVAALPKHLRPELLGPLSHTESLRLIKASKLVVMPSRHEGLPILPMECMAIGTPILASDIDGTREVIANGAGGYLAPLDDLETFKKLAHSLLFKKDQRRSVVQLGRAAVRRKFSLDTSTEKYMAIYQRLTHRKTN